MRPRCGRTLGAHELIRRAVDVAGSARHASCPIEQQGCWGINKTG